MNASKPFSLNLQDAAKAILIAAITAILGGLQQALTQHGADFGAYDWAAILDLGLSAGMAYLIKNYFQDADGQIKTPFGKIG